MAEEATITKEGAGITIGYNRGIDDAIQIVRAMAQGVEDDEKNTD